MAVRKNVLEAIGGIPLILLGNIMEKEGLAFSLYAKLERSNPSGSVKDRPAAMIVEDALRKGVLREGRTLVEAFFDASAICLSRSGMLPKRARIAPWQARISQTAPAFSRRPVAWAWAKDISEKSFADLWKRGMIAPEGRRS